MKKGMATSGNFAIFASKLRDIITVPRSNLMMAPIAAVASEMPIGVPMKMRITNMPNTRRAAIIYPLPVFRQPEAQPRALSDWLLSREGNSRLSP